MQQRIRCMGVQEPIRWAWERGGCRVERKKGLTGRRRKSPAQHALHSYCHMYRWRMLANDDTYACAIPVFVDVCTSIQYIHLNPSPSQHVYLRVWTMGGGRHGPWPPLPGDQQWTWTHCLSCGGAVLGGKTPQYVCRCRVLWLFNTCLCLCMCHAASMSFHLWSFVHESNVNALLVFFWEGRANNKCANFHL